MKQISTELLALDVKDQKILSELFKNGRANYSEIAKKTLLSKDAVQYRINKFIENGFMTNVSTIVDLSSQGWNSALVFLKLINLNKQKVKLFTEQLVNNLLVIEILELAGGWDFAIRFYYKDVAGINRTINAVKASFPELIAEYQIFFISKNILRPYNALFENYAFDFAEKNYESCKLDSLDIKILENLSTDGRKSLEDLSNILKENRMTVHNRIKKMMKGGIIHAFRPNLFTEKIGFHWYLISMTLNDSYRENEVVQEIKNIFPVHFIMKGFGATDIVFYVQVKTVQDLQRVLYTLREKLSKEIHFIESANVIRDYKWDFFPKGFSRIVFEKVTQ